MYNSLEVRAPLLHLPVLNLAFSLPERFKHRGTTGKYILRSLMKERLPRQIVLRGKHGFGLPVGQWFKHEWKELLTDTLSETNVRKVGLCEPKVVSRLVEEHLSGKKNNRKQLYNLLILHLWYATFQ
jgi:asparagine synthase (glutamine-hydrolysing)